MTRGPRCKQQRRCGRLRFVSFGRSAKVGHASRTVWNECRPMSVPEKSFEPGTACPLDGVRVIDMSRLVSGNMASLQLADFGAEVLKIEDPKSCAPLPACQTNGVTRPCKAYSRPNPHAALHP